MHISRSRSEKQNKQTPPKKQLSKQGNLFTSIYWDNIDICHWYKSPGFENNIKTFDPLVTCSQTSLTFHWGFFLFVFFSPLWHCLSRRPDVLWNIRKPNTWKFQINQGKNRINICCVRLKRNENAYDLTRSSTQICIESPESNTKVSHHRFCLRSDFFL